MDSDQYLSEVLRIIRENFRPNDQTGSMTVATAAYVVKHTLKADHTEFGFAKFKNVLASLEQRGAIKTGANSKRAFAIWLADGNVQSQVDDVSPKRLRPLKKQVWFAFVSSDIAGRRFLRKSDGEVAIGVDGPPVDGGEWAEIQPIDTNAERDLARAFLTERSIADPAAKQSIESDRWYSDFPKLISESHPAAASDWKRQRSIRVIKSVEQWCDANGVDRGVVFEATPSVRTRVFANQFQKDQELRRHLLTVIERMSTDEMLSLQLPAKYLIAEFRPELLR
jgi:hypothetical protein